MVVGSDAAYLRRLAVLVADTYGPVGEQLAQDTSFIDELAMGLLFFSLNNGGIITHRQRGGVERVSRFAARLCSVAAKGFSDVEKQAKSLRSNPIAQEKVRYFRDKGIKPEDVKLEGEIAFYFREFGSIDQIILNDRAAVVSNGTRASSPLKALINWFLEMSYGKGVGNFIVGKIYDYQVPTFRAQLEDYAASHNLS